MNSQTLIKAHLIKVFKTVLQLPKTQRASKEVKTSQLQSHYLVNDLVCGNIAAIQSCLRATLSHSKLRRDKLGKQLVNY